MPLQRHNAMRSRKNRSGVAFTDTEKSDIISNVEQQTPAEVGHLNKRQKHVSEEVRLQVHEAKLSMEENIAKAEKTEKILDEMDINSPSKMTKCRSLEDITGKKSTEGTLSLTGKDFLTKSENMSSMPTTLRTGTQEPGPDSKSENKRKNKSATTDKSEFKIAYVKKKAKKAKVFLKEKLTYHHSNEEQSKEYRANDGNKAAVFYISEPSASGQDTGGSHHHPNKPTTPSNQQPQQQTKTTQIDVLRGQVREVTNIMKNNVDEMAKRGEKLEDLETRSGHLEDLSNSFTTTAAAIQKKMKRRNRKVICVIAITVTAILLIVAVILLVYFLG